MYPDDKVYFFDDEISIILTLTLLWRVSEMGGACGAYGGGERGAQGSGGET